MLCRLLGEVSRDRQTTIDGCHGVAGGVPEYLDRSETAPQRQQNRPPDGSGDSDLGVSHYNPISKQSQVTL